MAKVNGMFKVNDKVLVLAVDDGVVVEVVQSSRGGDPFYVVKLDDTYEEKVYQENQILFSPNVYVTVNGVEIKLPKPLKIDDLELGDTYWFVKYYDGVNNGVPTQKTWDNEQFDIMLLNSAVGIHYTEECAKHCLDALILIRNGGQ